IRPVVLVLGPGGARGFAHAGALRALVAARIPIGAVVGTEMGALIGTLFAMEGNANHLDWALLRFKDEVFLPGKRLFSGFFDPRSGNERLGAELRKVFAAKELSQSRIPVRVIAQNGSTGRPILLDRGAAADAVQAAMTSPAAAVPPQLQGEPLVSSEGTRPYAVTEARALGIGPVVVIDTQVAQKSAGFEEALKEADLVIRPELTGIAETDYSKRTEAVFRGKRAILKSLGEIRHWVGLPQEGISQ
ncbi:MAG: patatin-like phospholipase family protein, partial [Oligoflexia bacterium]|nr:patatin-like phospholipase family protein [Oligoflexia bacterium]